MTQATTGRRAGPRSPGPARALATASAVAPAPTIWAAAALILLAVWFQPTIGVQASGESKAVLTLTHVAVGAVLIPVFWRTATPRAADSGSGR
ncbi:DUF6069 family protein [Actinomadura nitritigenes]|uniref:DUF6069 family protein n=1 Tax=Actinomadura nitritigenes TaxID=134602 RepID=UPI003D928008